MKTKLTLFVTVLTAALFMGGCASPPETSPPLIKIEPAFVKEGLVAYYPFNGNAKDASGNGNDGKVAGPTLTSDRFGESGKAYSFDGENDLIDIGTGGVAVNPHQLTQVAWIKTKDLATRRSKVAVILTKRHNNIEDDWPTLAIVVGGHASLINDEAHRREDVTGDSIISDGEWHQITGVRNILKFSIYIDGKIENSKVVSDFLEGSDSPMHIGHHGSFAETGYPSSFNGSIDDVRIYNRALSAEEVKALYDLEKPKGK